MVSSPYKRGYTSSYVRYLITSPPQYQYNPKEGAYTSLIYLEYYINLKLPSSIHYEISFTTTTTKLLDFLRVPFHCFRFDIFGGATKWSEELDICFLATCTWGYVPVLSEVSVLFPSRLICPEILDDGILVGSSWSCVSLLIKRLGRFRRDCFTITIDVPGSRFPTSWSRCPLTKKVIAGQYSLLLDRLYVLFPSFILFCRGGATKWSEELDICFLATCTWGYVPVLSEVSVLFPSRLICPEILDDGILVGSSWSCVSLLIKRLGRFRRYCFTITIDVPGSRFPTSWSRFPLTKKVIAGQSSLLFDRLYVLLPSFILFCRGGEVKIEVN